MNSPSIRRRLRLPWKWACCGGVFVYAAASFVTAQVVFQPVADQVQREATPAAVAPAAKSTAPPEFLPRLSGNEEKILTTLSDTTEVAFTDTPLEEALKYFEDLHSVEIWLDKESLAALKQNTDQPINLSISGISLRSTLRLILEPLALTYIIESEVLKITTQATADKAIITRTYPVSDLFATREEAEELVESLVCGLGLAQKGKEGPKSLAVSVPSAAIIARLSRLQQDQLLQLVRDLREAKSLASKRPVSAGDAPRFGGRTNEDGIESPKKPDMKLDEFSPGSLQPALSPDDFNPRPRLREFDPDIRFETPRKQVPPPVKPEIKKQI